MGVLAAFLSGCAGYSVRDDDLDRIERGEFVPGEAVLLCHGMLKDLGIPWDYRVRDEIAAAAPARLAIVITYFSGPLGVWFNFGRRPPGRLMASLADAMEELHRSTGCSAPLRLRALGFSQGCEAILEAAFRMEKARIERAVLLNSASFGFSREPRTLLERGKIGRMLFGWSPFDGITILAPLGAGTMGIRPAGQGLENLCLWNTHFPPLFSSGRRRARELLLTDGGPDAAAAAHTCGRDSRYRSGLAELLRTGRASDR